MTAPRLVRKVFTTPGTTTFVPPAGVKHIFAQGVGAGGGGGKGENGQLSGYKTSGGSGGGASTESVVPLDVTPGTSYDIIVGTGGAGATVQATHAIAGSDSRIQATGGTVASELVCWPGAMGGISGPGPLVTNGQQVVGAMAVREGTSTTLTGVLTVGSFEAHPGKGGYSGYSGGAGKPQGFNGQAAGGAVGTTGTTSGIYIGGGAGGGGAGGADGAGGGGGNGGNANSGGIGVAGTAGGAGAGYGAGGGGGGGGGSGNPAGSAGGNGGAGGGGRIILFWWE